MNEQEKKDIYKKIEMLKIQIDILSVFYRYRYVTPAKYEEFKKYTYKNINLQMIEPYMIRRMDYPSLSRSTDRPIKYIKPEQQPYEILRANASELIILKNKFDRGVALDGEHSLEEYNTKLSNLSKYLSGLQELVKNYDNTELINLCLEYKKTVDKLKINVECHEREIKDWLDVMAYVLKEGKQRFTACHTAKRFRHAANLIKNALKEGKLPNLCEVRSIIYNDPMEIPPSIMLTSKQQNTR